MSSFFIGPPDKQIFAVLSEPRQQSENNTLVVLCYPFGQEYMRAHRAYRQLANLLARSGFTALRFDYPACGDSYGDVPLESVSELMADLQRVVDTVQGRTQATRVYVVGLRFGALIAAKIAEQMPAVNGLFLWDSYALAGLILLQTALSRLHLRYPPRTSRGLAKLGRYMAFL